MANRIAVAGLAGLISLHAVAIAQTAPAPEQTAPAAAAAQASPAGATPAAAPAAAPVAILPAVSVPGTLAANTDVMLRMDEELNSKTAKMGDRFTMSVVSAVTSNGLTVIPAGTRGVGEVTYVTKKGSFGKSGKMEIELKHLELAGQRIPITGKYRQEGEGGTTATVVTAVLVGVFSAFVTGTSAIIPQGRELLAQTEQAIAYDPALAPKEALAAAPAPQPAAEAVAATQTLPAAEAVPATQALPAQPVAAEGSVEAAAPNPKR